MEVAPHHGGQRLGTVHRNPDDPSRRARGAVAGHHPVGTHDALLPFADQRRVDAVGSRFESHHLGRELDASGTLRGEVREQRLDPILCAGDRERRARGHPCADLLRAGREVQRCELPPTEARHPAHVRHRAKGKCVVLERCVEPE